MNVLRQYFPQRARHAEIGGRVVMVGTVPVGTVADYRGERIIVEAWFPRECHAGRFDRRARDWASSFHARGMFLAQVRSLVTGRRFRLSDAHLGRSSDEQCQDAPQVQAHPDKSFRLWSESALIEREP